MNRVMKMRTRWCLCALTAFSCLVIAQQAAADRVVGNLQGVFSGNDSVSSILTDLGFEVSQLAKVDWPATSSGGLTISNFVLNEEDEAISGHWDYTGVGTVDLLVVKAGPNYAAYLYNDAITNNTPNLGLWDTSHLSNKGVSHVTGYSIVPESTTALLLIVGLAGLGITRRVRGQPHGGSRRGCGGAVADTAGCRSSPPLSGT